MQKISDIIFHFLGFGRELGGRLFPDLSTIIWERYGPGGDSKKEGKKFTKKDSTWVAFLVEKARMVLQAFKKKEENLFCARSSIKINFLTTKLDIRKPFLAVRGYL